MIARSRWVLVAAALAAFGCGGDDEPSSGSGGAGGSAGASGGSGGSGGGAGTGGDGGAGGALVLCPTARPVDGSSCSDEGLECTFGDDALLSCRVRARCIGGAWDALDAECPPNGPGCPPTAPLDGVACADLTALCQYESGSACACRDCPPGPPCTEPKNSWYCAMLPEPAECPPAAPNIGSECDPPSAVECAYGSCGVEGQIVATCEAGAWVWAEVPCPQ